MSKKHPDSSGQPIECTQLGPKSFGSVSRDVIDARQACPIESKTAQPSADDIALLYLADDGTEDDE
jgi:hypothetical protein